MNKEDIQLLYKYNAWANTLILKAAARVTAEEFLAPASFPHGGLRSTLAHILFAEWLWRNRWEGSSPATTIGPEEFPTFASLRDRWLQEEKTLMAFVEKITNSQLNARLDYKSTKGDPKQDILWQLMAHVVNHGTQHRSEAAAMLTDLGHSPGDTDLSLFLRKG